MYVRIKELRKEKGLNQSQVAKELSMSQTGYSKYETGENDIPTAVLIKLAKFYSVSVDYILGLTDFPDYYD
ncbi:MAG: helix-turn-helix transcriptional regulator [Clostridia bacterium]|nr:helix-turn-helix transcriptional regulator [Clostridia bacterium]